MAIYNDFIIVGAPGDDENGINAGSAYVYYKDSTKWIEKYKILASDGNENNYFGKSVSISGQNVIVGASGSAYVYSFDSLDTSNVKLEIDSLKMTETIIVGDSVSLNWLIITPKHTLWDESQMHFKITN